MEVSAFQSGPNSVTVTPMMNLNRAIEQTLRSWQRAGLSDLSRGQGESLLKRLAQRAAPVAEIPLDQPANLHETVAIAHSENENINEISAGETEMNLKERKARLIELSEQVAACKKCADLAAGRTQTVFGVGNPRAKIMFIGEAPGADEDKQGEPFVGRAGKLLNTIIEACGWTREELYICNILRCRPDGNRNPTPIEAANCREFLDGQIETVNPKYIVCWGTIAAQNLLNESTTIGRMRGKFYKYGRAKVLCTYHPSYLLRNPPAKKHVWEDLKILLRELGIDPEKIVRKKSDS